MLRRWPRLSLLMATTFMFLIACAGRENGAPVATIDPLVRKGLNAFQVYCAACHAVEADVIIVGPSLAGIATRAGERQAGIEAETYVQTSILRPDDYLVHGFPDSMPKDFGKTLTGNQLDAIVSYLMTLE